MNPVLKIQKTVNAPIDRVYEAFLSPEDLKHWFYASEGWTTPYAEIDPKPGGRLRIGFRDPSGENTFDYEGAFVKLEKPVLIAYELADGRKVTLRFIALSPEKTRVLERFESDGQMPLEMQRAGWKAQLDHLEEYLAGT